MEIKRKTKFFMFLAYLTLSTFQVYAEFENMPLVVEEAQSLQLQAHLELSMRCGQQ